MKKLILIQNDYSGAGKSTLVRLLRRYLNQHHVSHQYIMLDEEEMSSEPDAHYLNPTQKSVLAPLLAALDESDITLMEAASGMGEMISRVYEQHELYAVFAELGIEVTVVLPVNNDPESFDAVTEAAEVFSDNVQYLIAHSTTSAYDEDDGSWDSSYAARVMDMFEAVEVRFPAAGVEMESAFRAHHTDLATALLESDAEMRYGKEFARWLKRSMGQTEAARQYLFGDAFRSLADCSKEPAKRGRKAKAVAQEF